MPTKNTLVQKCYQAKKRIIRLEDENKRLKQALAIAKEYIGGHRGGITVRKAMDALDEFEQAVKPE